MKFFVADDMATGADKLDHVLWYHRLPPDESGIKYPFTRHNNLIYSFIDNTDGRSPQTGYPLWRLRQ